MLTGLALILLGLLLGGFGTSRNTLLLLSLRRSSFFSCFALTAVTLHDFDSPQTSSWVSVDLSCLVVELPALLFP